MLIVGLVLFTGVTMILDVEQNYDEFNMSSAENDSFAAIYSNAQDILDETYDTAEGVKNKTLGGELDETTTWESMLTGGYSAIRLVTGSFGLITAVLTTISDEVGIPPYFITVAFTIVVILVIFGLIYLIFRFKG